MTSTDIAEARKLYSSLNEQDLEQAGLVAERQEKALRVHNLIKTFEHLPEFDREAFNILVDVATPLISGIYVSEKIAILITLLRSIYFSISCKNDTTNN